MATRIGAILAQRCPVCLEGQVFDSLLGMREMCPVCGVKFERENGYFLNAMFIAYVLGFSGASAFRRAFSRWTGVAPTEYGRPRE